MAKNKSAKIPPKTKKVELIPKDLVDQWKAVQACATAFNVLDKGYFPHNYAQVVKESLHFLKLLHAQTVEVAVKHPQAHMISELKEFIKTKKAENETTENNEESVPTEPATADADCADCQAIN